MPDKPSAKSRASIAPPAAAAPTRGRLPILTDVPTTRHIPLRSVKPLTEPREFSFSTSKRTRDTSTSAVPASRPAPATVIRNPAKVPPFDSVGPCSHVMLPRLPNLLLPRCAASLSAPRRSLPRWFLGPMFRRISVSLHGLPLVQLPRLVCSVFSCSSESFLISA
jgi:hypothetical protein